MKYQGSFACERIYILKAFGAEKEERNIWYGEVDGGKFQIKQKAGTAGWFVYAERFETYLNVLDKVMCQMSDVIWKF